MAFSRQLIITSLIFLPIATFAETKDVLIVNLNYDSNQKTFTIIGIEQKVLDDRNFTVDHNSQRFELTLSDGQDSIDYNFFTIPDNKDFEVFGIDGQPMNTEPPSTQALSVPLVLTKSITPQTSELILYDHQMHRNGNILVRKKLSEIPYEISDSKSYSIYIDQGCCGDAGISDRPPTDHFVAWNKRFISAAILSLFIIFVFFAIWRKIIKKRKQNQL